MVVSDFMKHTNPKRSKFHKDGFLWRNLLQMKWNN
jgi:hypothetical protein